jgi:hypothetical protein
MFAFNSLRFLKKSSFVNRKMFLLQFRQELDDPVLFAHLLDHVQEIEQLLDANAQVIVLQLGHHGRDIVRPERISLLQDVLELKKIGMVTIGK